MKGSFRPFRQELVQVVDLDERGWFKSHVGVSEERRNCETDCNPARGGLMA